MVLNKYPGIRSVDVWRFGVRSIKFIRKPELLSNDAKIKKTTGTGSDSWIYYYRVGYHLGTSGCIRNLEDRGRCELSEFSRHRLAVSWLGGEPRMDATFAICRYIHGTLDIFLPF